MIRKDPVTVIPLDKLQLNEGQLDWLPRNPRSWTQTDIDRTKRSLEEDTDFMQDRPLLAVPGPKKGTFVVFAGNLRLTSARALGWPGAPVVVYHPEGIAEEDRETIRRRALKDNGSFGSWDTEILANEWEFETWDLEAMGIPDWITGGAGKDAAGNEKTTMSAATSGDANPLVDFKVGLAPEEFAFVKRTLGEAGGTEREALLALLGYDPDGEAGEL